MQLAMIGLGRMGANLVRRLTQGGHECVIYDVNEKAVAELQDSGAAGARSLADVVEKLEPPRTAWIMVPAAYTQSTVDQLAELMQPGDTIIDGGNSYYRDDVDRAAALSGKGLHYLDVGTSGGIFGLERGYCLMIGGEKEPVERLDPIWRTIAPGMEAAERTPARSGPPSSAELGYLHCGSHGAGHFVKMVHNGIEYGMMGAIAEGLGILHRANIGERQAEIDAETAPLQAPQYYRYDLDTAAVAELWRRGSVVASWLLDLTADSLARDPKLQAFEGRVSDSGEGRWTVEAAIEEGVPAPVITTSLYQRFSSRGEADFSDRILSAMRSEFGGHVEKPAGT